MRLETTGVYFEININSHKKAQFCVPASTSACIDKRLNDCISLRNTHKVI